MIEASFAGLLLIFQWPAFGFMLLGIAVGFAVGILPGIGAGAALALMLPFSFEMTPVSAFAFLLGMMSVTATTGDITAILFGIPGEATSAATVVDGYPMAKAGQAGRALGASLVASAIGAVFGAIVMALSIPVVRPLVLSFGAPEFFMMALLGISFIASLSGRSVIKGLIMGGLGLLISMIGPDPQKGVLRYTLSQVYLLDGLEIVPVVIGLFAIPEIIALALSGSSIAREQPGKLGGVMQGARDAFRHWPLVLRSSTIGVLFGLLPGTGGGSQWVSYAHAVQTSGDKSRFGKGAVEGVIAPSAANNAKEGGSLIPTVAFGVPGSIVTAILLGAFVITGLVPGPDMLTKHLDITFSMVWTIVVSNIITVAICLLFIDKIARITLVKGSILIPFLISLVFLGGYTTSKDPGDLVTVLLFGLVGWVMVQCDWPRPPLLLGFVLGTWVERYLYISVTVFGAAWLWRPAVIVIILVTVGAIVYQVLQERQGRRRPVDSLKELTG